MIIFYVIVCLLALVAAVYLINLIEHDPGYLLLSYDNYTLETSVWVALALLVIIVIVVWILLSLLVKLLRQSRVFGRWFSRRGTRKAQQLTQRGVVAFNEGHWERAHRLLSKSAEQSPLPLVNYLYAAKASSRTGDAEAADKLLAEASKDTASLTAIELTQAEMQIELNKPEDALATLSRLRSRHPHSPRVIELLKDVYLNLQDWKNLQTILPEVRQLGLLADEEMKALEQRTAVALMEGSLSDRSGNYRDLLASAWKQIDRDTHRDPVVLACYIRCLQQTQELDAAEKLLRKELNENWSKALVDMYGELPALDPKKQLIHVEKWLQEHNSDPALLLCAGRVAQRAGESAKAKEYLSSSLQLLPRAEAYQELAGLYAKEGNHEKCAEYFLESQKLPQTVALIPENRTA